MKTSIRSFIITLLIGLGITTESKACAFFDVDYEYYNLFMQELISDPQYYPFLASYESRYYHADKNLFPVKDENIEEWENYLELSYERTLYLVFKASEEDVIALIEGKVVGDEKLNFATPSFVKKHKAAFEYLAYAKYLEPYMKISGSDNSWYYPYDKKLYTADQLDYDMIVNELLKRWRGLKDKELKLRYGYQLVRFAHYNRNYQDAVSFFDQYVESLHYKPAMYYHALSQKAGAERGLDDVESSLWDFFQVFVHSRDLKTRAYTSMCFNDNVDFATFFAKAKTEDERNNIYLLLGYAAFNDPLNEVRKIVSSSPDAIQAKLLMTRAINQIERETLPLYYSTEHKDMKSIDRRYPLIGENASAYLERVLDLATAMTVAEEVKDKNFWFLTASYLKLLQKEFSAAQQLLDKVNAENDLYTQQKDNLAMLIDICKHPQITSDVEVYLFEKYLNVSGNKVSFSSFDPINMPHMEYSTKSFVFDVLANRYFIQQDYAKSFLLNNHFSTLENNPQPELLIAMDAFYHKLDKNEWEHFILSNTTTGIDDVQAYIDFIYGIVYLTQGDLEKASASFAKTSYTKGFILPSTIFGYNQIECFDCSNTMVIDYLSDFPFIPIALNFETLTKTLVTLDEMAHSNNKQAAKANYLLGNFFYNVSEGGYFRHVLRFGSNNGSYSRRYGLYTENKLDLANRIYFKYYAPYYEDPSPISRQYLEKAYRQASDNELKARIVFALSKCEQLQYTISNKIAYSWWDKNGDDILISDRTYFKEMMRYKQTKFFDVVQSHCKYFDYYVRGYVN